MVKGHAGLSDLKIQCILGILWLWAQMLQDEFA